jgi:hypothetical protein
MKNVALFTLQAAAQLLQVPKAYRLIHLCESGCIKPAEDSDGRGTVRRFNRDNLLALAVCIELQNAGVVAPRILQAMKVFEWRRQPPGFV